jgi:hypothetical protein
MNPVRIVLALADAIHLAIVQVLSPVADELDLGHSQETTSQPPVVVPQAPVPFAGETSDEFALRFPVGIVCTIPTTLKYDPWFVQSTPAGFVRGTWIPAEAGFTAPVG